MAPAGDVTFWLDENMPPVLAKGLRGRGVASEHFRDLGFTETPDQEVFALAGRANAVIVTKDSDFAILVLGQGSPPQILWVRTGNMKTPSLLRLFEDRIDTVLKHLAEGAPLVALE